MFSHLQQSDPDILALIEAEAVRQRDGLTLIPSENHTSASVLETLSTVLSDKYAEGYPGKRYYSGNQVVDQLETLAQERAKALFKVPYVNVQPYSGSPANLAVYFATCKPGETSMGLNLLDGGHLTHGWKSSATSHFWKSAPYFMSSKGEIDFDRLRKDALEYKPTLIWCGGTAMPRTVPFAKFAEIADEVGAYLVADVAHIAGLIAGGAHESPIPYAHIVTTTTHKTLRGPRSALIFVKKDARELDKKIDRAVFPGLQGGPHVNQIAAVAVALKEAASPSFKKYAAQVKKNATVLASELHNRGWRLISGGTDSHLILIDTWNDGKKNEKGAGGVTGKDASDRLEHIGIIVNKNAIPFDMRPPADPSGIRIGTAAETTRGAKEKDMKAIAKKIDETLRKK
jgi:glycine hydroxymethyltransferase